MQLRKIIIVCVCIFSVALCSLLYAIGRGRDDLTADKDTIMTLSGMTTQEPVTEEVSMVCVYVCGNVVNPGVYELSGDRRIADAIAAAGGAADGGDETALNLADFICDGQRIYVPDYEEVLDGTYSDGNGGSGLININTAQVNELMTLPGIGQSRAESIITYRQENGRFNTIDDIMNVSGIKDAAFSKIKDLICV